MDLVLDIKVESKYLSRGQLWILPLEQIRVSHPMAWLRAFNFWVRIYVDCVWVCPKLHYTVFRLAWTLYEARLLLELAPLSFVKYSIGKRLLPFGGSWVKEPNLGDFTNFFNDYFFDESFIGEIAFEVRLGREIVIHKCRVFNIQLQLSTGSRTDWLCLAT